MDNSCLVFDFCHYSIKKFYLLTWLWTKSLHPVEIYTSARNPDGTKGLTTDSGNAHAKTQARAELTKPDRLYDTVRLVFRN